MILIALASSGLYVADVFFYPRIQPICGFESGNIHICSLIDLRSDRRELLPYLLLRLAIDGFLYLLSRSGINAKGIARLPASV